MSLAHRQWRGKGERDLSKIRCSAHISTFMEKIVAIFSPFVGIIREKLQEKKCSNLQSEEQNVQLLGSKYVWARNAHRNPIISVESKVKLYLFSLTLFFNH